jgi:hypothetical protein
MPDTVSVAEIIEAHTDTIHFHSDIFLRWAAANGELETIKFLHRHGADLSVMNGECACNAARNGHIHILEYLHKHDHLRRHARYCVNNAAMLGRTDVLSFMLKIIPEEVINPATIDSAAIGGRTDIMIWLRDRGANLAVAAELSAAYAIQFGQIETLDWMLAQNLPINLHACAPHSQINATFAGHLKSLQWLERQNQPLKHNQIICIAANLGREDIVKWCYDRGGRVTSYRECCRLLKQAEENGHETIAAVMRGQINHHGNSIVANSVATHESTATGTTTDRFRHFLGKLGR